LSWFSIAIELEDSEEKRLLPGSLTIYLNTSNDCRTWFLQGGAGASINTGVTWPGRNRHYPAMPLGISSRFGDS